METVKFHPALSVVTLEGVRVLSNQPASFFNHETQKQS